MKQIRRFEDIQAWKDARILAQHVYTATSRGPWARDFALRDQIRRAVISVLSNISEGFERESDKEFKYFLFLAKGSASEVKAQLYVALDQGYLDPEEFENMYKLANKICALLGGFIRYLRNGQPSGSQTSRVSRQKASTTTKI